MCVLAERCTERTAESGYAEKYTVRFGEGLALLGDAKDVSIFKFRQRMVFRQLGVKLGGKMHNLRNYRSRRWLDEWSICTEPRQRTPTILSPSCTDH